MKALSELVEQATQGAESGQENLESILDASFKLNSSIEDINGKINSQYDRISQTIDQIREVDENNSMTKKSYKDIKLRVAELSDASNKVYDLVDKFIV